MAFTSIICAKKDVELVLESLSSFGEFHIEPSAEEANPTEYDQTTQKVEESLSNVNELNRQLIQEKTSPFDLFKDSQPAKTVVTAENWQNLQEVTSQQIAALKKQVEEINANRTNLQEKTAQLKYVKTMLTIVEAMGADLCSNRGTKTDPH